MILRFIHLCQRSFYYKDFPNLWGCPTPLISFSCSLKLCTTFYGFGIVCGHVTRYFLKRVVLRLPNFNHLPNEMGSTENGLLMHKGANYHKKLPSIPITFITDSRAEVSLINNLLQKSSSCCTGGCSAPSFCLKW